MIAYGLEAIVWDKGQALTRLIVECLLTRPHFSRWVHIVNFPTVLPGLHCWGQLAKLTLVPGTKDSPNLVGATFSWRHQYEPCALTVWMVAVDLEQDGLLRCR